VPNILHASLELATALISAMSKSEREHEETLTGTLLGSLLSSNTLLSLVSAHLDIMPTKCWWGSYSKYQSKEQDETEAGSGADFALLTLLESGGARLAIFQAKRGELKDGGWVFDANRVPQKRKKPGAKDRRSQMIVLTETAKRLATLAPLTIDEASQLLPAAPSEPTPQELAQTDLSEFDWIHYLIYTSGGAESIALRHLSEAYLKEVGGQRSPTTVHLDGRIVPFVKVVSNGCGIEGTHWLNFKDAKTAIMALPALLPLVPVVAGDSTGSHGPMLEAALGLAPLSLDLSGGEVAALIAALNAAPGEPEWIPRTPN